MKNKFLLLFLIFISLTAAAQNQSSTVEVFKPENYNEEFSSEEVTYTEINCVKWNLGMLTRGVFMLDYERALSDYFTAEVGLGITYQDYWFEIFNEMWVDNYYSYNYSPQPKGGLAFEGGIRLFPGEVGGFDGFYIYPNVRLRDYNIDYTYNYTDDMGEEQDKIFNAGYSMTEVGFIVGYEIESWADVVTWDYYFGIMYRKAIFDHIDAENLQIERENISNPFFVLGLKLGVPF